MIETIEQSPVSVDEFKLSRRILSDQLDANIEMCLLAACNYIENFTLLDFATDFEVFPIDLKYAVILKAAQLFENPENSVEERTTVVDNIIRGYRRWDRTGDT
jgi:hypothetical protein